jgi:GTP-binding protein
MRAGENGPRRRGIIDGGGRTGQTGWGPCDPCAMSNPFARARYALSAHNYRQLPPDVGYEVAFAGRSNAGKSSALNAMVQQNALARVSKTPGRTQQLVFFDVAPERHLVDLPGYGYAKVPQELQAHWQQFIDGYFSTRDALQGLVVIMDIRHPLKDYDRQMLGYAANRGLPAHAVLTKADKLSRGAAANTLQAVRMELSRVFAESVSVQTFSAESKQGVDELRMVVARWLGL